MRYAIIENNTVKNVVEATSDFAQSKSWIPAEANGTVAQIGGSWDGTQFHPAPPVPEPVPQSVSRAQGKAALIQAGLWSAVVAYVDAMTDPTEKALAEVALNDTTEWLRASPFLNQAATALGMSEQDLDNLFIQASQIQL